MFVLALAVFRILKYQISYHEEVGQGRVPRNINSSEINFEEFMSTNNLNCDDVIMK